MSYHRDTGEKSAPMEKSSRAVLASALSVGLLTAAVHAVTMLKELVVAYRFGTGDEIDAFLIAWLVPTMASVFVGTTFASSFIPAFVQIRDRSGAEPAERFYESAF